MSAKSRDSGRPLWVALFVAGERTGKFRLGKDQLLTNENGSSISFEDFAIAELRT
jgi:putative NADH-flavin reductase